MQEAPDEICRAMVNVYQPRKPRFVLGDRVVVVGPGIYRDKWGFVMEVNEGSGDFVYRYRVRFKDGTSGTFFGFELEIKQS